jgi:geranylgeranyl pyrophosphate synthase
VSRPFDLDAFLEARRGRVEDALERAVAAIVRVPRVEEDVSAAVRHAVMGGGKRLRPLLCVTAWESCRPDGRSGPVPEAAYDLAASIELIHAYSLVHDDLPCMDDAELRRGRATTHRVHGEDVAVRAGAALIPAAALQAYRACHALEVTDETAADVVRVLLEAAGGGGMVGGQWLDLRAEGRLLTEVELDELHRHKTGALLTAALEMGAMAAGASRVERLSLGRYGAAVGLAFQIADDILDATGDAETLGKNPSDAELDKSTYVSLHGLDEARARARALVDDACRALEEGGLDAPALRALARFTVDRRR